MGVEHKLACKMVLELGSMLVLELGSMLVLELGSMLVLERGMLEHKQVPERKQQVLEHKLVLAVGKQEPEPGSKLVLAVGKLELEPGSMLVLELEHKLEPVQDSKLVLELGSTLELERKLCEHEASKADRSLASCSSC
ncbi:hypothetical protein [Mariniblastus fucicola]|uniref:hypothetical protein n=1 Tax=Mariniblastus fucicola TaxID=980251 RepID=UPI0013902174|nr:hypothetical protein [Mariniblastus fucicola]